MTKLLPGKLFIIQINNITPHFMWPVVATAIEDRLSVYKTNRNLIVL